ncbi:hypothetical protein D3C84_709820 [compost metagenome]
MKRPTRVMRGSSRVACFTWASACTRMERNFQTLMTLPFQPWRFCLNSTGPGEDNFTASEVPKSSGLSSRMASKATLRSSAALVSAAVG